MTEHAGAKVMLVVPLHFRHRQKTVDQICTAAVKRVTRSRLILNDVSTLEPPGAVHRRKPTTQVTHEPKYAAHDRCSYFPHFVWTSTEALEHLADEFTVMPSLVLDLFNPPALFGIADRMPVTAV